MGEVDRLVSFLLFFDKGPGITKGQVALLVLSLFIDLFFSFSNPLFDTAQVQEVMVIPCCLTPRSKDNC